MVGLLLSMMLGNGLAALQGEPTAVRVGQVTVVTWPGQRSLGIELARRAGRPTEWPGLGRRTPGPLQLIVVPDGSQFDSLSSGRAPEWGAGIALPGARTILLRADRDDLYGTLRHELAHLALHQAVKGRVPLWFDEGYASWAAGEWDRLGVLDLNLAVVRGAVPDLRGLDGALRGSASTADAAYALAVSVVTELARRNPSGSLTPLLQRLEAGEDFDAAVLATTGLTMSQFDTQWRRAIRQRYSLATWLLAGGGWGVLAFSMWALVRIRRRADLPRRAALDEGWEVPPEATDTPELDRTQKP
ncbi:MAG TPA: peptidase MA family metallohydrolase [Gemmatimonadales bacterium]|nr:peptidase MA family metallohydrolase [Gemmatimonadales bacterium]